ncbi:adenylate kinase [Halovenus aranensis]|uniref:Putative adenylate kinase n=1 Tax=Halovenus aranensis TaxID=890420 RepID=A0A1G8TUE2_9EURY|nr:AAA family ATPase [Halovenus aranensis]SDJ45057.1 adenylate kinase [Halovenus aranensis]
MRVAVTGTPGTGKTTAVERLAAAGDLDESMSVVHLNDVIDRESLTTGYDEERESAIVDFEAVSEWLAGRENVVFESHLAHHFDADRVVVCRCHPETLEERLAQRDKQAESRAENAESEALDVVLTEAVETHGTDRVYEIATTDLSPEAVAREITAVVDGRREPSAGTVSYTEYL